MRTIEVERRKAVQSLAKTNESARDEDSDDDSFMSQRFLGVDVHFCAPVPALVLVSVPALVLVLCDFRLDLYLYCTVLVL